MDKIQFIKDNFDLPPNIFTEIAIYTLSFEEIIKNNKVDFLKYINKFTQNYEYSPFMICYKYGRPDIVDYLESKKSVKWQKTDFYALAKYGYWQQFMKKYKDNPDIDFCYNYVLGLAIMKEAEYFIVWLKRDSLVQEKVKPLCKLGLRKHNYEHSLMKFKRI